MTTFERGDIILVSFPVGEAHQLHARPAMVLHDAEQSDSAVSVAALTPEPLQGANAIYLEQGTYESARMGLVTPAYLNGGLELVVDRQFVIRKLGKCPQQLQHRFLALMRSPIRSKSQSISLSSPPEPELAFTHDLFEQSA